MDIQPIRPYAGTNESTPSTPPLARRTSSSLELQPSSPRTPPSLINPFATPRSITRTEAMPTYSPRFPHAPASTPTGNPYLHPTPYPHVRSTGFLERLFLGRARPQSSFAFDKKPKLNSTDPSDCAICLNSFATRLSRNKHACRPMRIHPCGHVIGAPCYFTWFNDAANSEKEWTCLLCTQKVEEHEESEGRKKWRKRLGRKEVVVAERVVLVVLASPVLVVGGVVVGGFEGGKWAVKKAVKAGRAIREKEEKKFRRKKDYGGMEGVRGVEMVVEADDEETYGEEAANPFATPS